MSESKTKYEQLCAAAKRSEYRNCCGSCGGRWETLAELLAHRCGARGKA